MISRGVFQPERCCAGFLAILTLGFEIHGGLFRF